MSISNKLKEIIDEILSEDELEETSTSANAGHYETPYAFGKDKTKEKENSENSTGYKIVKELYSQNYKSFKSD